MTMNNRTKKSCDHDNKTHTLKVRHQYHHITNDKIYSATKENKYDT